MLHNFWLKFFIYINKSSSRERNFLIFFWFYSFQQFSFAIKIEGRKIVIKFFSFIFAYKSFSGLFLLNFCLSNIRRTTFTYNHCHPTSNIMCNFYKNFQITLIFGISHFFTCNFQICFFCVPHSLRATIKFAPFFLRIFTWN